MPIPQKKRCIAKRNQKHGEIMTTKSNCCQAPMSVEGNVTKYFVCDKCQHACDAYVPDKETESKLTGSFNIQALASERAKAIALKQEEILEAFIAKYGYEPDEMVLCYCPSKNEFWVRKRKDILKDKYEKTLAFLKKIVRTADQDMSKTACWRIRAGAEELLKELAHD